MPDTLARIENNNFSGLLLEYENALLKPRLFLVVHDVIYNHNVMETRFVGVSHQTLRSSFLREIRRVVTPF